MCGIYGTFLNPAEDVWAGLDRLRHRGPDGYGVIRASPAVHGHVRLALLDLSEASAQPFAYKGGMLSFSGEVWNFRELRQALAGLGHTFRTSGDTEVLAAALDEWGTEALGKLEGMFAFAWRRGGLHLLARDRFGKVPLYVLRQGQSFTWMSERKAHPEGGLAAPLPPASWLDLTTGRVHIWYSLPRQALGGDILGLLEESVKVRLVADAPLCCLVSGGLDSSLILALARRHKPDLVAYTAVLEEGSPDLKAARAVCRYFGVELREVKIRPPTVADICQTIRTIEIASKAQIEIALLCLPLARQIRADGFKACLSGEAADELFGGYGTLCIQGASAADEEWRQIRVRQLAKMSRGNFVRCNKAFLAAGVECRLPFMGRELVETVLNLGKKECPPGKLALKRAAAGVLPAWVIRRPKETFQGGAGMSAWAARVVSNPLRFYHCEVRRQFKSLVRS